MSRILGIQQFWANVLSNVHLVLTRWKLVDHFSVVFDNVGLVAVELGLHPPDFRLDYPPDCRVEYPPDW